MVKTLTLKNINKNIIKFTYQVRGPIVNKAYQILEELKTPNHNYPFKKIYMCNIGNPQELGQMPITFMRQMVAACVYPELIKNKSVPSDGCHSS
ncbi:hypothetical protein MHBO_002308 [Bonamia ostreae]|uniref:Alanine aminotransferase n=1 Tax=Bonamia ostreae TaxID=126728 RepID=A0ABV2ALV4_9EUKA